MTLPDISEWYVGRRAIQEEIAWINDKPHEKFYLPFLLPRMGKYDVKSVIEFGCGTAHVAKALPDKTKYVGIDKNEWFIRKCKDKLKGLPFRKFLEGDVRTTLTHSFDLSMAWNLMKHFSLEEFDSILGKVLAAGRFSAFNVQLADKELDDGVDYHHVFVTEERVKKVIELSGHELIELQTLWEFDAPIPAKNVAFWTKKHGESES